MYIVDAFTQKQFQGNQAAVCLFEKLYNYDLYDDFVKYPNDLLQKIAKEMNLSETAFLVPKKTGNRVHWYLRWFTPSAEIVLCGHGTLASAFILFSLYKEDIPENELFFDTLSGTLSVKKLDNGKLQMNFPQAPVAPFNLTNDMKKDIATVFSLVNENSILDSVYNKSLRMLLISIPKNEIKSLKPDFAKILALKLSVDLVGIIITSQNDKSDESIDFFSRFFAPWIGINEDPVTGSAHCVLGVYWSNKLNKTSLSALQVSARSGNVDVQIIPNGRILLEGYCVAVLKGTIIP